MEPSPVSTGPKLTRAPRGVPTIVDWRQRRDNGVTGRIYGSSNFDDGERVETSPIVAGDVSNGSIVKTGSGSTYFLSDDQAIKTQNKKAALSAVTSARPGATIKVLDQSPSKVGPTFSKAPRGVPTIVDWRLRRDGGISGRIYGSSNFDAGEKVETSPIVAGEVKNGNIVKTGSGSIYFLSDDQSIKQQTK